jgi:putative oxidoreductase
MKKILLTTSGNWSATALRLVLGIVIFSHGAQSMLGWFDGAGLSATLQALTEFMGLPWLIALLVICIQFFGSIMLFTGIGTRIAALGIFGIFIGMMTYHLDFGFHMNWMGTKKGEGFEYHVLVLAMCVALMVQGGGPFSIDRLLSQKKVS